MDRQRELELEKEPSHKDRFAREIIFLSDLASEIGSKAVPGKSWAFHFPHGAEARTAAISQILSGQVNAEDALGVLKPDAFTYDLSDLEKHGLPSVAGRVRDTSAYMTHYDYPRFAQFVSAMQGTGITADTVLTIYDGIAQGRIRKRMIDSYGQTGRKQMEDALRVEAERTTQEIGNFSQVDKVVSALKLHWLAEDLQVVRTEQRDLVVGQLTTEESQLFEQLRNSYLEYVRTGNQAAYEQLVSAVKESFSRSQESIDNPQTQDYDENLQHLREQLQPYLDQAVPPLTPGDLAIPSDDSDEYHTPPVVEGETKEQAQIRPFFEISPSGSSTEPLTGYYASGRKSYFDFDSKTWSKKKQLTLYTSSLRGTERQKISGITNNGLKSIPIPNGYGLDMSSLISRGAHLEIFRDKNGCFYLNSNGNCSYSVDFLQEDPPFVGPPIADDTIPIHKGQLSPETESALAAISGNPEQKAEQLRSYLLSKHFYPGDGDLQIAQALQYKLRIESTAENYILNLDKSEYLECYSANTLYIAMLRKSGIPARLVTGHRVEGAKDGKARIDSQTGHAWAEVWDGAAWRRMDATPRAKQQKKDKEGEANSPTQEAKDGGIDRQDQGQPEGQNNQSGQSSSDQMKQMGDASDQDIARGESDVSAAKEFTNRVQQQKQIIDQKLKNAQSFEDLEKLQNETEASDMFDDIKKDIQDRLDAKEERMKDEIKEKLDTMVQDGFMDDRRRQDLEQQLDKNRLVELDRIREQIERESKAFNEYQKIKDEVAPLVDTWFRYFVERLPKQLEVDLDEDILMRQGAFNRRSVMRPRNLLFGTVNNPRTIKPSVKPRFLASIMVDVSDSMSGVKLIMARKLLLFYNELFSRISSEFGFIKYANNIFSDTIIALKGFDQDYESSERYDWGDGTRATIKARLMQALQTKGGTNMLPAIQNAATELNKQTFEYPDYASAFYFIGDGDDTAGNSVRIEEYLRLDAANHGFGHHMLSAIMLGNESQRKKLASIFGDENTTVALDFETLIEQSMYKFDEDIEAYLEDKII